MRVGEVSCFKPGSQPHGNTEFYNFTNKTSYTFDLCNAGRGKGLENRPHSAEVWNWEMGPLQTRSELEFIDEMYPAFTLCRVLF